MRKERVASEIKRQVCVILSQELRDPRLGFVTITKVELTADLRCAKVYFSVLGPKEQQETSLKVLNRASGYIRRLIGERLDLRFNPEIIFKIDSSIAYSIEIEQKLKEIKDEKRQ